MASSDLAAQVAATVINFQTPDLLDTAVRSFHAHYPAVPQLIIDNGSQDASRAVIEALVDDLGAPVEALYLRENVFHGPAMHAALTHLQSPYVYIFDSDTETRRGGFLEPMVEALAAEAAYGAGRVALVNRRGFADPGGDVPVLVSAHMLIKRSLYHRLPPFIHHGLPVLQNCMAAQKAGYHLVDYPVDTYVEHLGRGTAERFGYGLGLRSRLDYLLHKLGL